MDVIHDTFVCGLQKDDWIGKKMDGALK